MLAYLQLGEKRLKKKQKTTSDAGAILQGSSITTFCSTCFLFLTQTAGRADSAALLRIFGYLQCQMQVLPAFFHQLKSSLLTFQREVSRSGRTHYSLCFPYVPFHCNCTTFHIYSCIYFIFFGLLARSIYCIWWLYIRKEKKKDICVVPVPCQVCLAELF